MIEIRGVDFAWGKSQSPLFSGFSLTLDSQGLTAMLGPSGSGKSTLLRLIAGLEAPDNGEIWFGEKQVKAPAPDRTLVFQDYALFDWMTIARNIELAITWSGRRATRQEVRSILASVGLENSGSAYPRQLSGGMRQRAALARAIAARPATILLDEPFSALDIYTRNTVQAEVSRVLEETESGALLVTHYVEEAVFMTDRLIVIGGSPVNVVLDLPVPFEHPRSQELKRTDAYRELVDRVSEALAPSGSGEKS